MEQPAGSNPSSQHGFLINAVTDDCPIYRTNALTCGGASHVPMTPKDRIFTAVNEVQNCLDPSVRGW